ncbi:Pancreatic triacylglycerol lipase [Apostichopus japonicus]|uniref:Pancreatic triacylglycerol lipase n=1 Tax=Stichopus japonicus TaxID=307972 RepID=A0A2G8JC76_STIJA|nr:Pancreatic triacylglycerol lipase [Apostichopus japonicus]
MVSNLALDPAGPYFENCDVIVRLDHTDAEFVDVIHADTNLIRTMGMGMHQATGHADFYPNGGHDQPACPSRILSILFIEGTIYEGGVQYVLCDHEKAHEMYIESITSGCRFMASPTADNNLDNYVDGITGYYDAANAMPMGFHADKSYMILRHNTSNLT